MLKKIAVFCGSNKGLNSKYTQESTQLARALLKRNITLVYGGATIGLMRVLADEYFRQNGKLIGIMPGFLQDKNIFEEGLTEAISVQTMGERKEKMESMADGFIAMPGGYGTLDEIFEVLVSQQLDHHSKPIGLFNVSGYFNHLIEFLEHMVSEQFLKPENFQNLIISDQAEYLLDKMIVFKPVKAAKWIN